MLPQPVLDGITLIAVPVTMRDKVSVFPDKTENHNVENKLHDGH